MLVNAGIFNIYRERKGCLKIEMKNAVFLKKALFDTRKLK
jgi:hypothetical protein